MYLITYNTMGKTPDHCKKEYVEMKDIIKAIFILIACMIALVILPMIIKNTIYAPAKVNKEFEGIYFDFDNEEFVEPVNVIINGTFARDMLLRPKIFEGIIYIDSNKFEITEPLLFSNISESYFLPMEYYNVTDWNLNHDYLYNHFGQRATWSIFIDRTFSNITFVPMVPDKEGGFSSSSEIITAPCNNRDDAVRITQKLRSGRYE